MGVLLVYLGVSLGVPWVTFYVPWVAFGVPRAPLWALQGTSFGHGHPEGRKGALSEGLFADVGGSDVLKV